MPLKSSGITTINYQTTISLPYAHVIQDDKIPINSSIVDEKTLSGTYLWFNSPLPDQAYETGKSHLHTHICMYEYLGFVFLECFSFDDTDVSTPVVFTTDGHFLIERVYQIEHVTAINSSAIRMHQLNQSKPKPSTTLSPARPFDEFPGDSSSPNNPDGQGDSTTKSD